MRTLCLTAVLLLPAFSPAAPALGEKPPRWEYAELTYRTLPGRPALVDEDGKEVPAVPPSVSVRWITGAGEVDVKGWEDLAEKLKTAGFKKGSFDFQKIQVLNYLGSEGWELMEQQTNGATLQIGGGGGLGAAGPGGRGPGNRGNGPGFGSSSPSSTWLLKRRVP